MIIEIIDGETHTTPTIGNELIVRDYDVRAVDDYELDEDGIPCKQYFCTRSNPNRVQT